MVLFMASLPDIIHFASINSVLLFYTSNLQIRSASCVVMAVKIVLIITAANAIWGYLSMEGVARSLDALILFISTIYLSSA